MIMCVEGYLRIWQSDNWPTQQLQRAMKDKPLSQFSSGHSHTKVVSPSTLSFISLTNRNLLSNSARRD